MKNFSQFLLAVFAAVVIGLGWSFLYAEIALCIFAALAVFGESKRIAILEVIIPIVVIILFHYNPDMWLLCIGITAFLAVWNIAESISAVKEIIK